MSASRTLVECVSLVLLVSTIAVSNASAQADDDGDGIPNSFDNCRTVANPSRLDSDLDGYGNACDADYNNDGVVGAPDYLVLGMAYGSTETGGGAWNPKVDCNADDVIGDADNTCLTSRWAMPPGPSGLSCAGTVPCNEGCTGAPPGCDEFVDEIPLEPQQGLQHADCDYVPISFAPLYTGCSGVSPGPKVVVDTTHGNFHEITPLTYAKPGRYWGFSKLLSADGYDVRDSGVPLATLAAYTDADILVMADPTLQLTTAEATAVSNWVVGGGKLWLIFNHPPFDEVENLLAVFFGGIDLPSSSANNYDFLRSTGTLNTSGSSGITTGVNVVRTFTGIAFNLTSPVLPPAQQVLEPILVFPSGVNSVTPFNPPYNGASVPLGGYKQGLAFTFGAGRVYISGEAAMFTAQQSHGTVCGYPLPPGVCFVTGGPAFGMHQTSGGGSLTSDDQKFLLNIAHWLD